MRHLWAECPGSGLPAVRAGLERELAVPAGWWVRTPRATAKTGWIVVGAAADATTKEAMQIA